MREVKRDDKKILHLPDTPQRKPDDGPMCECHIALGNDFWFLPTGACLRHDKVCNREAE